MTGWEDSRQIQQRRSVPAGEGPDAPADSGSEGGREVGPVEQVEDAFEAGLASVEVALESLLRAHEEAITYAVRSDGIVVPMPASLELDGRILTGGQSALDLVIPEHRSRVIAAWERARKVGHARTELRLANDPARQATLHYFDAREGHGVYVAVYTSVDSAKALIADSIPRRPPRFARVRKSELAVVIEIDEAFTEILGWTPQEVAGKRTLDIIHPDDQALAVDNWMDMLAAHGPGRRVRLRHLHRDGSWVWLEITNHNLLNDTERPCVLAEMVDISDEMATHEALRAREQLLNRLAEALPLGLLEVDEQGGIVYTNDRLHSIVGVPRASTVMEQLSTVVNEDRQVLTDAFEAVLHNGIDSDIEIRVRPDGRREKDERFCTLNLRTLTDSSGVVNGAIVCLADVTESAKAREELKTQAMFDLVTNVRNRASTIKALESMLSMPDNHARPAVIFIDLDHFKEINDAFGHAIGDEYLQIVAARLQRCVRSEDVVGRIGGDEFLVVCPGISSRDEAMNAATRLAAALNQQMRLKAGNVPSRASIGVAWSESVRASAEELVAKADSAMYDCKHAGTGDPVFFEESLADDRPSRTWTWPTPPERRD